MVFALHVQFVSVLRPPGAMNLANKDIQELSDLELQEWKMVSDE